MTGSLDDGTAGLLMIKSLGGIAIVQDPDEALFDGMPRSALSKVTVDWKLKLADIASLLISLVETNPHPLPEAASQNPDFPSNSKSAMSDAPEPIPDEGQQVAHSKAASERGEQPGNASPVTCPDCGGVLWELREGPLVRFRCHVGHAYSIDSLAEEQSQDVEKSLWTAVRALEEKAALARRMAAYAREQSRIKSAQQFEDRAEEAHQHAIVIQQLILNQLGRHAENGGAENGGAENNGAETEAVQDDRR